MPNLGAQITEANRLDRVIGGVGHGTHPNLTS